MNKAESEAATAGNKFGAFKGVFVPSILTILGVILFLRLGWVVGQAGLYQTIFIITLSSIITLITGLSISSAATNSEVGPGGSYFLISRCFGVETGAAIGLPLYMAQALGISFYSVGFAESLALFFPSLPITYVALATLILLTAVTFKSSSLALKSQIFIFIAIILALLSFGFGKAMDPPEFMEAAIEYEQFGFWAIFAVFFPAVTGIEAGISMSGDLAKPRKALPIGTLAAVLVGYIVYVLAAIKFDEVAPKEILIDNSLIMTEVAVVGMLIYIGLWGATISSTMGALLGAPRTMQALAKDKILPSILAQGSKEANEPQIATLVSFFIAAGGIMIGDLNAIAAILSMFFLTSYGALNLVSGLEGMIANPSWRPTFNTPWIVSMMGALLCFGAMFMIDSGASFIALGLVILVFFIMKKRGLRSQYSDIRGGLVLHFARELVYTFENVKKDERNWRPNFLVFAGSPKSRLYLIDLANSISRRRGFMTVASILQDEDYDIERIRDLEKAAKDYLNKRKIHSLVKVSTGKAFHEGARALIRNYGIGKLSPNTVLLGDSKNGTNEYIQVIKDSVAAHKNLLIVRTREDFDETQKFGGKSIDIWWRGKEANAGLMLTLAYMLNLSKKWRRARLTLKTIVDNEDEREGIKDNMLQFLADSRIRGDVEVLVNNGQPFEQIKKSSADVDLVMIGLKTPKKEDNYLEYYNLFLEKTKGLPNTIFVLRGEDVEFKEIFD